MLRRTWVAAMVVLALGAGARDGHASRWSLHGVGTAMGGWTDNVENLPSGTADFFYEVAPGALFTAETPRMIHEIFYEFRYLGYAEQTEANSYSNRAGWRGFFIISPRVETTIETSVEAGETNAFRPPVGQPTPAEIMPAQVDYVATGFAQTLRYQWTRNWRLTQGLTGRRMDASDVRGETEGVDVGASIGGDRSWKQDGVGLTLSVNYIDLFRMLFPDPPDQPDPIEQENRAQINVGAVAAWRRDLSRDWASLVGVGATTMFPLQTGLDPVVSPTAVATLAYFPVWGSFRLTAQRLVAPNLYVAENTIADAVSLNGWLPLPLLADDPLEPVLTTSAGLSARRSQLVDLETNDREAASSYLADVALHYSPVRRSASVSIRYTYFHQDEDPALEDPRFRQFSRHSIMLSLYGRWPERPAAIFPHRDVLRVDERDRTPVGGGAGSEGDAASGAAQPGPGQ